MRARRWCPGILAAALLVASPAQDARAEVSANPRNDGRVDTLVMGDLGITDGVDPIPQIWKKWRPIPVDWVLNPSGEQRGDGPPHVAFHEPSGWPVVVWAYRKGDTHDIALSFWNGAAWAPIEFVTNTALNDDLDPQVFVEDNGNLHVVWWIDGNDTRVQLSTRVFATSLWTPSKRVSPLGEPGRRPSVARHGEQTWVAYERNATESVFNTREIAVVRELDNGAFDLEYVVETQYDGEIPISLHSHGPCFWMVWRYAANQWAHTNFADATTAGSPTTEVWTDSTWVGIETVRRLIENLVTGAPHAFPIGEEPDQP